MKQPLNIEPGTTPDSPIWGLDLLFERIQIMFTANKVKKIELRLRNIEERVEEIKIMVNKNKLKAIGYATEEKEKIEEKVIEESEKVSLEVRERVMERLQKHIRILEMVREKYTEPCPIDLPFMGKGISPADRPCIREGVSNAIQKGERNIERFRERNIAKNTEMVCCKITPVVAPEHREATTKYEFKLKGDCTSSGKVGVGYQIVNGNFC